MSDSMRDHDASSRWSRLAPWLLIGGLLVFHTVNNWVWLSENVTSTGWDKPRHLARSLNYTQMLSPPTIPSLFGVMVSDPVRPPFFPASAAIMYKLFGFTADAATMVNILYMALALAATYGIGRRWAGRQAGAISVVLLALFPMFFAMSRYFYLEFALTAMVALTVCLMLTTDGFQHKGRSLLFGLVLGLGLLTKRTFAVFAAGPIVVGVLASGLLPQFWRWLWRWFAPGESGRPRLFWKNALLALVGGLVLATIWYLPNRDTVRTLVLGDALFFCWWVLAALTIYFATLPSTRLSNALGGFSLAAVMASTWYLARIEFLERVALYGYGIDDPRGRSLRLDDIDTYLYYVRKLGNEHLSLVLFVVLALVMVVSLVLYVQRQGKLSAALRSVRPEGWAVLAWLGSGYAVLTLSIYQETRAFTPVLPAIALLAGVALYKIPWQRVRWGLLALIVIFGLVQFAAVSYEPVYRLLTPQVVTLPGWGRTTTLAQGVYIQLPDEGKTDSGYWIHPDVLQRMEAGRQSSGYDLFSMALLANTQQINAGPFTYLILTQYPSLRVESLISRFDETSPYPRLFAHDYVGLKRVNSGSNPVQDELIATLLDDPPLLFTQVFEREVGYDLPGGDTFYLYGQRAHLPVDYPVAYVTRLGETLAGQTQPGDGILVAPPALVAPFIAAYGYGPAQIYLAPDSEADLATIASDHRRLVYVIGDPLAGEVPGGVQAWLNEHAFRAAHTWSDSLQTITYGTVQGPVPFSPGVEVGARLGEEGIVLSGYHLPQGSWQGGDIVPLTLFWSAEDTMDRDYNVFVQLLDGSGSLVAQTDAMPAGGSRPTSGWVEGEIVIDRHGLDLPLDLPSGDYEVRLGMYLQESGERLMVTGADGQMAGDSLVLTTMRVGGP